MRFLVWILPWYVNRKARISQMLSTKNFVDYILGTIKACYDSLGLFRYQSKMLVGAEGQSRWTNSTFLKRGPLKSI